MNVIMILIDSLNKHMLEPYGGIAGASLNFKRFAERAVRFDNHYVGSLPCMPARREIFTGRRDFLWRPWGHLEAFDRPLPEAINVGGYKTHLITDHYHYWEDSAHGYIEPFQGMELIRGQEMDNWKCDTLKETPAWVDSINRFRPGWGTRYYNNVKDFKDEHDFFSAKLMKSAVQWLDDNHGEQPYFLHLEPFDVHEPFHCPEPYRSMWTNELNEANNFWPPYQDEDMRREFFETATEQELAFVRAQYMGKVSMIDHWFGHLLDTMDRLNIWDDTVVIVTTDHGHDLGERRQYGKQYPHWDSHANIPLLIYHPSYSGGTEIGSFTSTVDLYATVLDFLDIQYAPPAHSRSLLPLLECSKAKIRDAVLYGIFGGGACCTDGEYCLFQGFDNVNNPLYSYTGRLTVPTRPGEEVTSGYHIPGISLPVWKIPTFAAGSSDSMLVSKSDRIGGEINIINQDLQTTKRMRELMVDLMKEEGCPPEQFARLGLWH